MSSGLLNPVSMKPRDRNRKALNIVSLLEAQYMTSKK
jgi:hypothetical protein